MNTNANLNANDFETFRRQLTLFYYTLMGSMVLIYVVLVIVLAPGTERLITKNVEIFLIAIPLINLVVVATGSLLFRFKVKAAIEAETEQKKVFEYRIGWLIRGLLLESLCMLNAFAYYTMHDMKFEIMYILVLLLYVISAYPNPDKLKREMGLS